MGIAIALIVWVFGVLFLPFLMDDITTFREAMECSSNDISGGNMLVCLGGDFLVPYAIWTFFSIALVFIIGGGKE